MKEYPNNWERVKNAPDEAFQDDLTWEAFEQIRLDHWSIPASICAIIREEHYDNRGKLFRITEKHYQRVSAAEKHLAKRACSKENNKFLIVDNESMMEATPLEIIHDIVDMEELSDD